MTSSALAVLQSSSSDFAFMTALCTQAQPFISATSLASMRMPLHTADWLRNASSGETEPTVFMTQAGYTVVHRATSLGQQHSV